MSAQAPAGSITNPQFLDRGGIVQSALVQIVECLGMAIELVLIESGGLLQNGGRVGGEEHLAAGGKRGFGKRTDGGTAGRSAEDRRPDRSRDSRRDFCGR